MRFSIIWLAGSLVVTASHAQNNPVSAELKQQYAGIKNDLMKAAERMPDGDYSFKPEGEPRTFGQLLTHIAEVQLALCGATAGEQKRGDAGSKTTKADVRAALKGSFDYCDPLYEGLTDASATQMIKLFGRDQTKLGTLYFNVIHDNEMYGQVAVYYRLKNMVPPSTADRSGAGRGKNQ
jgi:hypothetical protein